MIKNGQVLKSALIGLALYASPFVVQISGAADVVRSLSLEERVARLENMTQQRNQVMVNLQYKLAEIQEELGGLRGTQEEHSFSLEQLTDRQRDIYRDVDTRLGEVREQLLAMASGKLPVSGLGSTSSSSLPSTGSSTAQADNLAANPKNATETVDNDRASIRTMSDDGAESYNKIFPLVRNKNYSQAIDAYKAFIATYPQSKFIANSHYWLGQVYFVQGRLEDAVIPFQTVLDKYPDFTKSADAMLKLAIIKSSLDDKATAVALFQRIINEYPATSTARMAEKRLKELNL